MSSEKLDNLVRIGKLRRQSPSRNEFGGLIASGTARLRDAKREELSLESRFDLAYNAPTLWHWQRYDGTDTDRTAATWYSSAYNKRSNLKPRNGVFLIKHIASATSPSTKAIWRLTSVWSKPLFE